MQAQAKVRSITHRFGCTALERLVGKQALELEFQKGHFGKDARREARPCP